MSLLVDIAEFLETKVTGTALEIGTNLFMGQAPDEPDEIVVVFERPGQSVFTMGAEEGQQHDPSLEMPRVQVMVRTDTSATAYPDGLTLIYEIHRRMSTCGITLNGTRYVSIDPVGTPAPIDEDKQGRLRFVANFLITREPETLA